MHKQNDFLKNIYVETPCTVGFENMQGDERVRFCNLCKLNVHNLAELSDREVAELIQKDPDNLCIRIYRRPDGRIVTDNCPVKLRKIRNCFRTVASVLMVALFFCIGREVHAQGLVGAPVDGGLRRSYNEVGQLADLACDTTQDKLHLITGLTFSTSAVVTLCKTFSKRATPRSILCAIGLIVGATAIVYLSGTFVINNLIPYHEFS